MTFGPRQRRHWQCLPPLQRSTMATAMDFAMGGGDRVLDSTSATELLASLGFLLVPGPPTDRGPAYLLVGVRRQPTLRHFDPQRIELWAEGPAHVTLEWPVDQLTCRYSW